MSRKKKKEEKREQLAIRTQVTYLDCLWDELYGSINANQWGWDISKEQADYLRQKYLFGPEEEPFLPTDSML